MSGTRAACMSDPAPVDRSTAFTAAEEQVLAQRLSAVPGLLAVYLHGSAARGGMRPGSDLDLGCLFEGSPPSAVELLDLAADLGAGLPFPLDVGLISSSNLIYSYAAVMEGRCIYCRNETLRDLHVATVLGLWAQFAREREEFRRAYSMAG